MINCYAIDNDQFYLDVLTKHFSRYPSFNLKKTFTSSTEALVAISSCLGLIDVVFVNVEMPEISGIELARKVNDCVSLVIFVCDHDKCAIDFFGIDIFSFLLRPISTMKFDFLMQKITKVIMQKAKAGYDTPIFIRPSGESNKLIKIEPSEVVALESSNHHSKIYLIDKQVRTYMSLNSLKEMLDPVKIYLQVHRSFVVNIRFVDYIQSNNIFLRNGLKIPFGKVYKKEISQFIKTKRID